MTWNATEYKVEPQRFWEVGRLYDGYDRMDIAAAFKWRAVSSWGRDGWDLGDWPYVVFYFRTRQSGSSLLDPNIRTHYEVAVNIEGDTYVHDFPTVELRDRYIDDQALWYWQHTRRYMGWTKAATSAQDLPAKYRGPFSWARLEAEKRPEESVEHLFADDGSVLHLCRVCQDPEDDSLHTKVEQPA